MGRIAGLLNLQAPARSGTRRMRCAYCKVRWAQQLEVDRALLVAGAVSPVTWGQVSGAASIFRGVSGCEPVVRSAAAASVP